MNFPHGRLVEVDFSHYNPHDADSIVIKCALSSMYYWNSLLDNTPFLVYHIDTTGDTFLQHGD